MTDNVVTLQTVTTLDIPPERVLSQAIEADMDSVVIVGWKKTGEFYFAASEADLRHTAWALQRALHDLLKRDEEKEDQ
jgi:hypothetical protein